MCPKANPALRMFVLAISLFSAHNRAAAQEMPKPLDPNDPRTSYSFPIQPGGETFRFTVLLDRTSTVSGVSVFRKGEPSPFQNLPTCMTGPGDQLVENDVSDKLVLLKHADLNFDGFEDLELRVFRNDHLDKNIFCIYLWDEKTGRFLYSKDASDALDVNPEPDPVNKTITVQDLWQGGAWQVDTYRWSAGKLELIEENSLLGDWSNQKDGECGFTFTCSRLVNGEMVTTLEKPVCTDEEMSHLPECPAPAAKPAATK